MNHILKELERLPKYVKITSCVAIAGVTIVVVILKTRAKRKRLKNTYPRDTVILHQRWRGPYAPSLVPFAIKVETFLRMTKIPYINVHGMETSPKGKWPWIEYNGETVSDSKFIIDFLVKTFNVKADEGFSELELSVAHCFQKMMEENTYWTFVLNRWVYEKTGQIYREIDVPGWTPKNVREGTLEQAYAHGIGRHSEEEVNEIMRGDLTALSLFLDNKQFLLGDRPCVADCAIFGQLVQFYRQSFGSQAELTVKEFPNLCSYCERMKERYWPDWDDCNTDGGRKRALK